MSLRDKMLPDMKYSNAAEIVKWLRHKIAKGVCICISKTL